MLAAYPAPQFISAAGSESPEFSVAFFRVPDYDALLTGQFSPGGLAVGESGLMFCAAVKTESESQVPNLG